MTTQPEQQTAAPEVVAWHVVGVESGPARRLAGEPWVYRDALTREDADEWAALHGGTVVPLVTQPDALAYADARAVRAVEQERARVVAWLRGQAAGMLFAERDMRAISQREMAEAIERGEHLR